MSSRPHSILVVDDDDDVRELAIMILEEFGYRVTEAADGEAGLRALEADPGIELLFTDIVMPGLDGVALADRAKELHPEIKVLYATGFADRIRSLREGGGLHGKVLAKPYRPQQLIAEVRRDTEET